MNSRNPSVFARPFSVDNDGDYSRVDPAQTGLDLRTHVAVKAMHAMITGYWAHPDNDNIKAERMAVRAFEYADAFMAEFNRPADEAQAKRDAEIAAGRELVKTARYFIGSEQLQIGTDISALNYVWDRHDKTVIAAQRTIDDPDDMAQPPRWQPINLAQAMPGALESIVARIAGLEQSIVLDKPYDIEDWGFDVTNDLPEWAQPKD